MIIICLLIIAAIVIITVFINWYANRQTNKKVVQQCYEKNKIDRYEKKYYEGLEIWQITDRLNNTKPIVSVYDLPDSIVGEIIDYSLKIIEEGERK
nr:MAG TPA: holin [Caudoviricetes sp.]